MRASGRTGPQAFPHFAIVVRGEVVSMPFIDVRRNPNGIHADAGVEISGLDSKAEADRIVHELTGG
jgi:hypothetical protein